MEKQQKKPNACVIKLGGNIFSVGYKALLLQWFGQLLCLTRWAYQSISSCNMFFPYVSVWPTWLTFRARQPYTRNSSCSHEEKRTQKWWGTSGLINSLFKSSLQQRHLSFIVTTSQDLQCKLLLTEWYSSGCERTYSVTTFTWAHKWSTVGKKKIKTRTQV